MENIIKYIAVGSKRAYGPAPDAAASPHLLVVTSYTAQFM